MSNPQPAGHVSSLVFCSENVDPDVVTAELGLQPTSTQKLGKPLHYPGGAVIPSSHLGTWKLKLPGSVEGDSVEEQIERWLEILKPKTASLRRLRELNYAPYLDCPYRQSDLSVCIEPPHLAALGELQVSLSIWLYDPPASNQEGH
jgi:hypothetical protein